MNILFIDTETTGLDPSKHTIIEIACRLDVDGKTVTRHSTKFYNPNAQIDLGALRVNKTKITDLVKAKPEAQEVAHLVDWLVELPDRVQGEIYLSGQNVTFDKEFLKALLGRYNVSGLDSIVGYKVLDTFGLALALVMKGKLKVEGKLNLGNIAKALGVDLSKKKLHTADDDTDVAAEVLYKLLELI